MLAQGDEVAAFAYGGSIIATLFGVGAIDDITFFQDLLEHSHRLCETRIRLGQSIGRATRAEHAAGHSVQD
jgi:phosphatidylserine decarboxylase